MNITDAEKSKIYEEYSKKVLGYMLSQVNDTYIAEDLCSDVFLKVYQKLDTFDETKSSISTWIYNITRNTLTDYYRTRRVMSEIPETVTDESPVDDEICNNETLETLADALEALDSRERDIIIYHYYNGMILKDVAEKLGLSYSYVKAVHQKALSKMKKFF